MSSAPTDVTTPGLAVLMPLMARFSLVASAVDAAVIVSCEKRGAFDFVARFYDRATESFYSGAASTALEAIAWAFDDYVARVDFGFGPSIARVASAKPGDRLCGVRKPAVEPPMVCTSLDDDRPVQGSNPITPPTPQASGATPTKSAATRRASTRKRATK